MQKLFKSQKAQAFYPYIAGDSVLLCQIQGAKFEIIAPIAQSSEHEILQGLITIFKFDRWGYGVPLR